MASPRTTRFLTAPMLVAPIGALVLTAANVVQAATPTYYNNEATFLADVTENVVDDYSNGGYVFNQNDGQMSAVLGETDYHATGHANTNLVTGNMAYCAGCNGSFELSFQTTTVGEPEGVNGVGLTILSHDLMGLPYFAYITFADGTTADIMLPPSGSFWGVSAPERIERIHFGLSGGVSTTNGYFEVDDLIVGDGFDETPCGDAIPTPDEECDDGGDSATCDANCTLAICGDGTFNVLAGEACDDGGASPTCNADCSLPFCGDGVVNMAIGEDCDDMVETAACNADCTVPMCGDDVVNVLAGEVCDDGGESPGCDGDCTLVECGDGLENNLAGEFCDDGNLVDGDGCSSTCTNEDVMDEGGESSSGGRTTSEGGGDTGDTSATTGVVGDTGEGDTGAGDTAADTSGGGGSSGDGGSNSATADDSDPETATLSATNADDDSSSGSGSGGANESDGGGCGCNTDDGKQRRGSAWFLMTLLGLGALGRRRRGRRFA